MSLGLVSLLESWGIGPGLAVPLERAALSVFVLVLAVISDRVTRGLLVRILHQIFRKTKARWDDRIAERGVLLRLSRVAPAVVIYYGGALVAPDIPWVAEVIQRVVVAWVIIVVTITLDAAINVAHDFYAEQEYARRRPIKGFVQLAKTVAVLVAAILVVTTVLDQSPLGILSGLGAMSAVLLLVFRDPILGFVSGIQLTANNLVEIGDWIEMPKYDADGSVVDITLQSVMVQNWDKTITTIPIYALMSDSFRNWRGMSNSGGRRIKRSVSIDMRSVRFCTPHMIERFRHFRRLRGYLEQRLAEIDNHNQQHKIEADDGVSGRRLTNLGVFRAYIREYIREHDMLRDDMTCLVRQLAPQANGIPIEVYVFSADQRWDAYENIQADIFDHLLAVLPEFGLRVFQEPSGFDYQELADAVARVADGT